MPLPKHQHRSTACHPSRVSSKMTALSAALALSISSLAAAQESEPAPATPSSSASSSTQDLDVISVVGIRGSLERATERKRYEVTISDSISAEDVGKFPDANIADSLQRVTGVQIDRTGGGEGRFVSVRGLNSQMNLTTYNGRVLASDNPGRDFSFDVMPTELLSRVSVYKTPTASQLDGSIGGLIELSSFDALSRPGFHFNASASGLYDDASSSTNPRFGVMVSNTFHDNTIGVFGGLSWYKRKWRSDTYWKSDGYRMAPVDADGDGIKDPDVDGLGTHPGVTFYQVRLGDRERMTFSGGVNWKPNERLKSTVDTFYSRYKTPEYAYSYNLNFTTSDGENRMTKTTLEPWGGGGNNRWLTTRFELDNIPLEIGTDNSGREVDLWQLGWNTRFEATDKLGFDFDLAWSVADQPHNALGNAYLVTGVNGGTYTYDATAPGAPIVTCTLPDGRYCIDATNDEIGLHFMNLSGDDIRDEVFSARIDTDFSTYFGDLYSVLRGGVFYSSREKTRLRYASPEGCAYCGFNETFGQVGINAEVPFPSGGYRGGPIGGNNNRWPAQSVDAILAAAIAHRGQAYFDANIAPALRERESSWIEEDQYGGYLQASLEGDNWEANAGLRYVRTDMTSRGFSQELLAIIPIPGSVNFTGEYSDLQALSESNVYGEWLPSFNLTWRLSDHLQLRGAASRGIARPTFTQLGVDIVYGLGGTPATMTRSGNPQLEPVRSDALDLSLEWYGDNGAAASLAGFYKDIDGFVTQALVEDTFLGQPFLIFNPINGDSATLYGLEFASQYLHSSGFGGQVNYTYVHSKSDVTLEGVQRTTALEGVSKSNWNLQAIYEKGPLAARLSYSWRDEYISCQVCGPANVPITTAEQGYLDFNASWQMNESVQFFLQAYNLTEEEAHRYALDKRFTTFYEPYAKRYEVGVRVSF